MNNSHLKWKISVFGLGYVGCITSSCLTHLQHQVIGIDTNKIKVDLLNNSEPPVKEPLLKEYISLGVANKLLTATTDTQHAIDNSNVSFICVGTPSKEDGSCDLSAVINTIKAIAIALKNKYTKQNSSVKPHIIIIRSTIPPGTIDDIILPLLEKHSKLILNIDYYVCFHPEFLREGCAISDFFKPALYVIGESKDPMAHHAGDSLIDMLHLDITDKNINIARTNYKTAELVKYTDNVWHALKVSFANEIGTIAEKIKINARELMSIFCLDTKLNISEYYLKPGLSYGGSCLPKDLRSLQHIITKHNINLPLINSIENSNQLHIKRVYDFINQKAHGKIGWYGITFKDNTDDLRNSVYLEILANLVNDYDVKFADYDIDIHHLIASQDQLLKTKLPNYQDLHLDDFTALLNHADTLIIGHAIPNRNYKMGIYNYDRVLDIIDLTDNNVDLADSKHRYYNIFNPPEN